jgi:murein L,D-transpeptidase YafK
MLPRPPEKYVVFPFRIGGCMFLKLINKILLAIIMTLMLPVSSSAQPPVRKEFLAQQQRFERVRNAQKRKADVLARSLGAAGLASDNINILIVAYKAEATLEVYAKKPDAPDYRMLAAYPVCAVSGVPGPKRRQGDRQVPEGFYHIDRFNPVSNYHMSLGIDYPNAADRLKTRAADPGGDIFIHGSCLTVGCLPMTDDKIMEIYLYAVYARDSGQSKIPVYIFPFRMTPKNMEKYGARYHDQPELLYFWENLRTGHEKFMKNGKQLKVSVDRDGNYTYGP